MYYTYVLRNSRTGEFYKGITDNIDRRIGEHNNGKTFSTKNRGPFELVYVQISGDRQEARGWEKFFKSGIGRETIKELAAMLEWYTG